VRKQVMISLKGERDLRFMRQAGRIVADVLDEIRTVIRAGMTTAEIDALSEEVIRKSDAAPAFKGYRVPGISIPFPGAVCVSINSEIVHGIPSAERFLEEGDIVSVDVGACYEGYYGDAACTFPVGIVSEERMHLLRATQTGLERAIEKAHPGNTIGDIGHAVEAYILGEGFGLVRDYTGHGIGRHLHEPPQVPNYGHPGRGITLKPGMVLAIEPMVMAGGEDVVTGPDDWVVLTADGSDAAHFERTVLVTCDEPEILTPWTWE